MLGFRFTKFDASTYVIQYQNGKIKREGRGLSFWYFAPTSTMVAIPLGSSDTSFIFNEITSDFQKVSVQGQITYKIEAPERLAELLDFTVKPNGNYATDDYEKLSQRLVNEAQTAVAADMEQITLRAAMRSSKLLEEAIMQALLKAPAIKMLGIIPLSVHVLGIKPTPEMARALETETREALQKEADQAIYDRRKFAVEQERKIKESELNTQIAVEEKQKQIAEKKMETGIAKAQNDRKLREMKINADVAIENERQTLIDLQTANQRKQADTEIYRLEKVMAQYKELDWKLLMAMQGKADAGQHIAMAFRELAANASKIGTLNITPDLLESVMQRVKG